MMSEAFSYCRTVLSHIALTGEHALKSMAWQVDQELMQRVLINDISPLTSLV